jgi:hypothetical protein
MASSILRVRVVDGKTRSRSVRSSVFFASFHSFRIVTDEAIASCPCYRIDLRATIEKERRESRRLSGALGEREQGRENVRQSTFSFQIVAPDCFPRKMLTLHFLLLLVSPFLVSNRTHRDGAGTSRRPGQDVRMQQTVIRIERERDATLVNIENQPESALGSLDHPSAIENDVASTLTQDDLSSKRNKTKRFSAMGGKLRANQMEVLDNRISSTTSDVADKILAIQMKVRLPLSFPISATWIEADRLPSMILQLDLALRSMAARHSLDSTRSSFDGSDYSRQTTDSPQPTSPAPYHDDTFGSDSLDTSSADETRFPACYFPSFRQASLRLHHSGYANILHHLRLPCHTHEPQSSHRNLLCSSSSWSIPFPNASPPNHRRLPPNVRLDIRRWFCLCVRRRRGRDLQRFERLIVSQLPPISFRDGLWSSLLPRSNSISRAKPHLQLSEHDRQQQRIGRQRQDDAWDRCRGKEGVGGRWRTLALAKARRGLLDVPLWA